MRGVARPLVLTVLSLTTLGTLAACNQRAPLPPTLEVGGGRPERVLWNATTFVIPVDVTNPDPEYPLALDTANYSLTVGETRVGTGAARTSVTIPPKSTVTVNFPIEVGLFRLADTIRKTPATVTPTGQVAGTLSGVVTGHNPAHLLPKPVTTPFSRPVSLPTKADAWGTALPTRVTEP